MVFPLIPHYAMRTPACFTLLMVFMGSLFAAAAEIELTYPRLTLKNGKTYGLVEIKSLNQERNAVIMVHDRVIETIPLAHLPDEVRARVESLSVGQKPPLSLRPLPTYARTYPRTQQGLKPTTTDPLHEAKRVQAEARAKAAEEAIRKEKAKQTMRTHARNYFGYEYKTGSGAIIMTSPAIEIDEAEWMNNWDRYRVTGKAFYDFYDSKGSSFSRGSRLFEGRVEVKPEGSMKVVDFFTK